MQMKKNVTSNDPSQGTTPHFDVGKIKTLKIKFSKDEDHEILELVINMAENDRIQEHDRNGSGLWKSNSGTVSINSLPK